MSNALIVDDSKTARYALRQLLDKQKIASDMVESAEQALEYLRESSPDLIFMDHMMPGMDGFEAVKLIKANPATQHIPIVMYTSTQGGVYFGQARALGAADVIAKPATAQELQDVLRRITERQRRTALTEAPLEPVVSAAPDDDAASPPVAAEPPAGSEVPVPAAADVMESAAVPPRRSVGWLAAVALVAVVALGWLLLDALADNRQAATRQSAALEALQWALGSQEYPYGEAPFAGDRLARLQELLVHLQAMGFSGTVVMESHVGDFCLVPAAGAAGAEWTPAMGPIPITECGALGQSRAQSLRMAREQSADFQRFLERSPLLLDGTLSVELVARGAEEPVADYPASAAVSADVWNALARRNNRVDYELRPRGADADGG